MPGSRPRSPGSERQRRRAAYLGSTYVPADDSCFCRFEAETADDVRDANEIAGVPFARIVATEEIGIGQPGSTEKGDRIMNRTLALVLALAAAGILRDGRLRQLDGAERSSSRDEGVLAVRRRRRFVLHDHLLEHPGDQARHEGGLSRSAIGYPDASEAGQRPRHRGGPADNAAFGHVVLDPLRSCRRRGHALGRDRELHRPQCWTAHGRVPGLPGLFLGRGLRLHPPGAE